MTTTYRKVVDISRHQGAVNFVKMRAAGVDGVIIRVGHGQAIDDRFATYWNGALAAGFTRDDLAVYTFVNPKRGTAVECADAMLTAIDAVVGDTRVGYMLDVEQYAGQTPLPGTATLAGPAFAEHIREHRDHVLAQADGAFVFGYTARSFWNGPSHRTGVQWVGDAQLAAELEWLAPRYPVHSTTAYARYPLPASPDLWDEWAFARQPNGPLAPIGGTWLGWQLSADFNGQGARYGCQSDDLDLNIIDADAWARWTARTEGAPQMTAVVPARIVDTRTGLGGRRLAAGEARLVNVPGTIDRPTWARGAFVDLEVVAPAAAGHVTAWAAGDPPATSDLNFTPATSPTSNMTLTQVVPLDGLASASFYVRSTTDTDLLVDFKGWSA